MWYFSWILGTAFACSLAVLYGLWFELKTYPLESKENTPPI
ncbi:MAG: cytochrome bd-I oxidase subunit CydX [Gammaproteobacteria bacterium]|nr:cytochrome bd-I oxidase subunit CydX [Gammaproteobacteria bacterium]